MGGWLLAFAAVTWALRCQLPWIWTPELCGSTAMTTLIWRAHLEATRQAAGAVRRVSMLLRTTPKSSASCSLWIRSTRETSHGEHPSGLCICNAELVTPGFDRFEASSPLQMLRAAPCWCTDF